MPLSRPASIGLLAALRAEGPPPPPTDELRARAADDEEEARRALHELAERARGFALGQDARRREAVSVELDDGTALTLDDAERLLCRREERGPHRPLRRALERALRPLRRFHDHGIATPIDGLEAFLQGTRELGRGALDMLEALAGTPLDDDDALARALDLPEPAARVDVAKALLALPRERARVPLRAVRVPRLLAGVVLLEGAPEGGARVGVFEGPMRLQRFQATVVGGVRALAHQAGAAPGVAEGLALGIGHPALLLRAGLGKSDAERMSRGAAGRALLQARLAAALALGPPEEAWERALPGPFRPTGALRELLDERGTRGEGAALLDELSAASVALRLRDSLDEAFVLDEEAWRAPLEAYRADLSRAWQEWLSPWL